MGRFFIFYMVACVLLFASLTGIFTVLKVHTYFVKEATDEVRESSEKVAEIEAPPFTIEEYIAVLPSEGLRVSFEPPPLMTGYLYRLGGPAPIYDSEMFDTARTENFPAKGIFELLRSNKIQDTWVHEIKVSDGRRAYTMFLKHEDIASTEFYRERPHPSLEKNWIDLRRSFKRDQDEYQAELEVGYAAALVRYKELDALHNPENPFKVQIEKLQASLAEIDNGGIAFSAVLAGIITIVTAVLLGSMTWLRRTRVWESEFEIDNVESVEDGVYAEGDDEPPPPPPLNRFHEEEDETSPFE